jgi:hypothetical protein
MGPNQKKFYDTSEPATKMRNKMAHSGLGLNSLAAWRGEPIKRRDHPIQIIPLRLSSDRAAAGLSSKRS